MYFPESAYKNKKIFEGDFFESAHKVEEIDVKSGEPISKPEKNVFGNFAKIGIFNPYKSTSNDLVYDEIIFCHIKINDTFNKDIVPYKIILGTPTAKALQERFPKAWVQFEKDCPEAEESKSSPEQKKERAELLAKARELKISGAKLYSNDSLKKKIAELEPKK